MLANARQKLELRREQRSQSISVVVGFHDRHEEKLGDDECVRNVVVAGLAASPGMLGEADNRHC